MLNAVVSVFVISMLMWSEMVKWPERLKTSERSVYNKGCTISVALGYCGQFLIDLNGLPYKLSLSCLKCVRVCMCLCMPFNLSGISSLQVSCPVCGERRMHKSDD